MIDAIGTWNSPDGPKPIYSMSNSGCSSPNMARVKLYDPFARWVEVPRSQVWLKPVETPQRSDPVEEEFPTLDHLIDVSNWLTTQLELLRNRNG